MKKLLLVLLTFISLNAVAQIKVKEGSFHQIEGFVMLDKNEHLDMNNAPMALIKISTENIKAEERRRITFKGNLATYFDVHFEPTEIYLYITAQAATFIEIHHPDYGKTEYWLPQDLKDFCAYEMVLQYVPLVPGGLDQLNNYLTIIADQPNASIYIDEQYVSDGYKSLAIGTAHTWKIECDMYHTESGTVTITGGEPITIEKKLRPAYGFINVTSTPESGAVVFVNNKRVGTTPYQSDKMASGTYNIRVVKDMYKTAEQTFVVNDEKTTDAAMNLSPNFVNLTIDTDTESEIYVDGQYKEKGKWSGRVSEGSHFVEVKKDKHRTVAKNLNLVLGKDVKISIEDPVAITGFLDVSSFPVKADIYLNGKHYGTTPRIITDLMIGDYILKLEKQGCASVTKTITIEENKTLSIKENLPTGKDVVIKTGQTGDEVYVDGSYVGTTPLTTSLSYGKHELKATRGIQTATKDIDVKADSATEEYTLAFGKMIKITSDESGDDIYVDRKKVGQTPMDVDMPLGKYEVEVRRGNLYETKTLQISKNGQTNYYFVPRKESLDKYLSRGIKFVTLNAAYSIAPQTSFGLTFGQVKQFGWYVSAMSNFDFTGFDVIDKSYEEVILTGESRSTRLSVIGGFMARIGGPVCARAGAGYGMIIRTCETIGGDYVNYPDNTYKGIDLSAGLQLNLRNIAISVDAVTTNFEMTEVKLGVGVNFN